MYLILQFLKGPLAGKAVTLKRSVTVGRVGTDLKIDDPKLSQIHAFIQFTQEGRWVATDNNSHNGLLFHKKKTKKIVLEEGVEFQMGSSLVRCKMKGAAPSKSAVSEDQIESFAKWLVGVTSGFANRKKSATEINPQINLRFIEGLQYGTVWSIFYGPRKIGRGSTDLCLYEEGLPENLFVIEGINKQPYLKTPHFDRVRVNGDSVEKRKLIHGDVIQVGDSKLQVEMILT